MIELWTITFALLLVRTTAFLFVVPVIGGGQSPHLVKIGLALTLSLFWLSQMSEPPETVVDIALSGAGTLSLFLASAWETMIGALLGFAFQIVLIPAKIAGAYVAQELGLNLASMSDPTSSSSSDVVANLTQSAAILLFFAFDFHHLMVTALDQTVQFLPVATIWPLTAGNVGGNELAGTMAAGLQIVAPLAIVLLVVLAALFILARAVPTLNLFSVGLAARLIVGLAVWLLLMPQIVHNIALSLEHGRQFIVDFVGSMIPPPPT